ncbi:LOW QUALITY PROTEIN: hypothetical protein CRUP_009101, partial [Coryphaenoides rupestris]
MSWHPYPRHSPSHHNGRRRGSHREEGGPGQAPLTLECEAAGHPPPSLTWLKDGVPVQDREGVRVAQRGATIEIASAAVSDAGHYVCVATSIAGEKAIKYDVNVLEGRQIRWFKDGQAVRQGEGLRVSAGGRRLVLSRAQVSDTARFQCVATNEAGDHERDFNVVGSHVPPSIRATGPSERSVVLHKAISLRVSPSGPAPSITWLKDGRPVDTAQEHLKLESVGRVLQVTQARLEDSGRYSCRGHECSRGVFPNSGEIINQTILSGFSTQLECKATGSPAPAITVVQRMPPSDEHGRGRRALPLVALNVAGSAEISYRLQVHVAPVISSRGGMVTVVVNEAARLDCVATGLPPPSLTWLKDGRPVAVVSDGIQVLSGGRVLSLTSAQVSDTGTYACVAVNSGGEQQREYDLRVYVPPNIMGEEVNATVMLSGPVELLCQSDAITATHPIDSSQVQDAGRYTCEATNVAGKTEKNYNLNVWVSPSIRASEHVTPLTVIEGSLITLLQISSAERVDTASYTCTATSPAGTTSKEYSLQVYVRPSIRHSEDGAGAGAGDITIVTRGGDVSLQCAADGVPRPAVTWLKDGRPIAGQQHGGATVQVLNEGRLLHIKNAKVSDTGRYTCIAVNVAGQADRRHDVVVPENVSVVVKNPVALTCEASGIPLPAITWLKDQQPIKATSSVRILSGGRSLRLMHVAVEDAGRYTCVVSNSAGEERKNFDVNVLVPPSIVHEGTLVDTKVKEKHNITLTCEATGNPVPEIRWLKDGQPLPGDFRHQVLSHGRFLLISGAAVADTGRYSCLASNSAGDRSRHINLNVLVSPTIAGSGPEGSAEEVTVTLSNPTSLVCEVQSYPAALVTWLKDGSHFESSRNVRVLPGGRTLQILNAKEEDAGRYTCVATNEAGETLKNYEVKVFVPPQINKNDIPGEGLSPKEVKIKVNHSLTLECEAQAIPMPALQWYKDGQVLTADDHVTITSNGRVVQIKQAQVSDTGRYTCIATNVAGEDEKDFDVNIQVPPSFNRAGGAGDTISNPGSGGEAKEVVLNNPLSLYCETNAVPPPTLSWYKDGRPLASNDKVLILPGGRVLQIPRAQAEDSGRYTCVAVNEAGEDSIQYDVRVLNAQVSDTGRYVCVADNVAGSADKSFNVNVHVPPSIVGLSPENQTVVVNNFVSLTCESTGFPPPMLSWLHDRGAVAANTNALIMPGGRTLQILRARVSDGGKYTCVAVNPAGEARKIIFLTVFVPPSIRDANGESPVVVNVRVGKAVTLECESNAVPPPTVTWYKNGRAVTETANLQLLAQGQMLQVKGAEVSDTGQYVCKASNVAGQVDKNFHLNVYIPPSIDGPPEEPVVETISNPVTLACDATGIPPPSLTWLKNERTLGMSRLGGVHKIPTSESLEMHILSGGSKLQIARSQVSDGGTYTCVATNVEGTARKSYHLIIQVPPSISGSEMPSDIGVLLNDSVQLVCRAQGTPIPSIQWLKDGEVVNGTQEDPAYGLSVLTVSGALTSDSAKYTCVATNAAGEDDRIFNLNVYVPPAIVGNTVLPEDLTAVLDGSVNMECVVTGSPPPQLNWLRNGLPLPVSSHVSDGGTYTCVASNRAGVENRHYNLQVHVPPSLDRAGTTEDVTVVRGNPVSLVCIAEGTPHPAVSWLKEGLDLDQDLDLSLLNLNTTLQLTQAQVNDTGRYTCVADNVAGQASRHFNLKVLDPPSINGSEVPVEVSVVVNHVLELECEAWGIPAPSLTWLKDGRPLPQTDSMRLLRGGEVLRVASAQVEDTGRYTCLAYSPAGDDDKEFLVRVHVPPNIAGESAPQDVSVLQGRQVTLECKSDAVPPPTLTWLKDGAPLQASARVRLLSRSRYLQINMAELSDRAHYTCVATNVAGETARQFNVTVN